MAEGPRDALVSIESRTYRVALFAWSYLVILIQYGVWQTHTETDGQTHDNSIYCACMAHKV